MNLTLDVIGGTVGTIVWAVVIVAWNVTLRLLRTKMDPLSDFLIFVPPREQYQVVFAHPYSTFCTNCPMKVK